MRFHLAASIGLVATIGILAPAVLKGAIASAHIAHAQPTLPIQAISIHTKTGRIRLSVEFARTLEQQEEGLMFRRSVPALGGMIFPIQPVRDPSFWMKDTVIPLDMLFIRQDGSIARIVTAQPLDETPNRAHEPVAAVLEIGAGRANALGIKEGDKISW